MKTLLLTSALVAALAPSAMALNFNQTIASITTNPSGSWTADANNGALLGLRARYKGGTESPNDGNGTYLMEVGPMPNPTPPPTLIPRWNIDFIVAATGGQDLADYNFWLRVDTDPGFGSSFPVPPIAILSGPNYLGTTLGGGGTLLGPSAANYADWTIAQNSYNAVAFGVDPNLHADYSIELYATAAGTGPDTERLASTFITVQVGNGAAGVPDASSTVVLMGLALAGLAHLQLRRKS